MKTTTEWVIFVSSNIGYIIKRNIQKTQLLLVLQILNEDTGNNDHDQYHNDKPRTA